MWLDGVILLPLIIYALIKGLVKRHWTLYIVLLACAIIFNYYIGYMICIFMVIAFCAYTINNFKDKKIFIQQIIDFVISSLISGLISAVVIIGLSLYLGIPLVTLGFILVGFTIGTYIGSLYFYMRDYRLLDLNWSNFTELTQRGMTQGLKVVVQLATLALGALIMFGLLFWFAFVINELTRLIVSILILIAFLISIVFIKRYAEEKFWSQFNL